MCAACGLPLWITGLVRLGRAMNYQSAPHACQMHSTDVYSATCSPKELPSDHAMRALMGMQVDCNWAGSITIRVLEYLTVNASYLKLILFNVAGPATIKAVAVKTRGTPVSYILPYKGPLAPGQHA